MSSILVGMFDTQAAANTAKDRLTSAGFTDSEISMAGGSPSVAGSDVEQPHEEGTVSRFFSNLFGGESDDESRYGGTYQEAFRRGSYGVTVKASDEGKASLAEEILDDCGAVDIDEKADAWRKEGWIGGAVSAPTLKTSTTPGNSAKLDAGASQRLQEVEEELKVGKRTVGKGGVRIFTRMTETPVTETVRLREERADVRRTAVDRPATEADFAAFKEGSIEVRETAEEAVVSKTARVTGEVEIGKTATEREETIHDSVRKTHVDVERLEGDAVTADSAPLTSVSTGSLGATRSGNANRDPITGEPGSHPVGTGVGAAAGGVAAGAAVGTVAGPVGTAVGAVVGAVAGGLAGKGVAEKVDPTLPDAESGTR